MATAKGATGYSRLLNSLAKRIVDSDPERAIQLAQEVDHTGLKENLLNELSRTRPLLAADHINLLPRGNDQANIAMSIAKHYAQQDPEGALKWALELEGVSSNWAIREVAQHFQQLDSERAVEILDELDGAAAATWLQAITTNQAFQQPYTVLEWLQSQQQRPGYERAIANTIQYWSSSEPESALAWVSENLSGNAAIQATLAISNQWASQDPQQAAQYVSTLDDGRAKEQATENLLNYWLNYDRSSAIGWVEDLPSGYNRDSALRNLGFRSNGAERTRLMNSIGAENLRFNAWSRIIARAAAIRQR